MRGQASHHRWRLFQGLSAKDRNCRVHYNSYGLVLAAHEPFESVEKAVSDGNDIVSHTILVQHVVRRKTVADTDNGKVMRENIRDLENLLQAYREGTIVENP